MRPTSIEPMWSTDPPILHRKEVVVSLPFSLNFDGLPKQLPTRETVLREMRNLDGTPGKVILTIKDDVTAASLYHAIFDHYGDLVTVRFTGECLKDECADLIREFSKYAISQSDDVFRVIIESSFFGEESKDNLSLLLNLDSIVRKNAFVDDVLLKVRIPGESNEEWPNNRLQWIAKGILSCLSVVGTGGLRTVIVGMQIDELSSMKMFTKMVQSITKVCSMDDRFQDLNMLVFDSVNFCFFPTSSTKRITDVVQVTDFVSRAADILVDNGFDQNNVFALPFALEWGI